MDLLPQEIIDEIINNLPHSSLRSSSLVAKRWRKRSQQRAIDSIGFSSELMVNRWHAEAQSDLGEVSSYVRSACFFEIVKWRDPALFNHILEGFTSLTTLWMFETEISGEMAERISRGELCQRITTLQLSSPRCSISTVVSLSLSFPNLQKLCVDDYGRISRGGPLTYPVLPRREPLNLLLLSGHVDEVAEVLANSQFTSRRIFFDFRIRNIQEIITLSSAIIQELMLVGMHLPCV